MADYFDFPSNEEIVDTSLDSKVILTTLDRKHGPIVLDCTNFKQSLVKAGHVIIEKDGNIAPMPVNADNTAYDVLPTGYSYAGLMFSTRPTTKPLCTVVTAGSVNCSAAPYPYTADMKSSLSHIIFEFA